MDMEQRLAALGLSERESRVYLSLLAVGPTTTTRIIRKTGIASSKIYDVLEKLEHKGLASHVLKNGKKEYSAADPERIVEMAKEREELARKALPELHALFRRSRDEASAEVLKGREGAKAIFDDILKEGKDWVALGASGKGEKALPYFLPRFYERMNERKISARFLFIDEADTREQADSLKRFKNIKSRFLPKRIKNLMVTFIYADKVALIPITPGVESMPVIILIRSEETAESQRAYFDWLWGLRS